MEEATEPSCIVHGDLYAIQDCRNNEQTQKGHSDLPAIPELAS